MKELPMNLQRLQCQFFCTYPVNLIDWNEFTEYYRSWEGQKLLLDSTCAHSLNIKQPIKVGYQLNFLKCLLSALEANSTEEIHDEIYEKLCNLQQTTAIEQQKFSYKHYLLPSRDIRVTLRESNSFVSKGTTGLCSWQASLALADYLLHHSDLVEGKSILELGAGTGLCCFIIMRCRSGANQICLTDGSQECITLMHENISLNFPEAERIGENCYTLAENLLSCHLLSWESIEEGKVVEMSRPNLILAADVVYDTAILPALSKAVDYIFKMMLDNVKMILAATLRNEETLGIFLKLLADMNFSIDERKTIPPRTSLLFWDRTTPVKLFLITRCGNINNGVNKDLHVQI